VRKLSEAIEIPLGEDLVLQVTHVGYTGGLPRCRAVLWNGKLALEDMLRPNEASQRERFTARAVKAEPRLVAETLDYALLNLAESLTAGAPDPSGEGEAAGGDTQAAKLVTYATTAGIDLWHTADQEAFATITIDGHKEHHPVRSRAFRGWLSRLYHEQEGGGVANSQAMQDADGVLEAKALYEGIDRAVFTRVAALDGAIYLDLGEATWAAVEINAAGWRLVVDPPARFRRSKGMHPLPVPRTGGNLSELRRFIHIEDDKDWVLLCSWLAAALRPVGPYPILCLFGEQGSGKSTTARLLASLLDPRKAELRATPKDVRDVAIASTHSWLVGYDNISGIPDWFSDVLCRLATGGGFGTRQLYTDDEEALFDTVRPVVLNAIEEVARRGDLLDRAIVLTLPVIPEERRRTEAELWAAFEEARPRLLGALLDAVSTALRALPAVRLGNLPRMADFAVWAAAVAPALGWEAAAFLDAYASNRAAAHDTALDAVAWLPALRGVVPFEGTATTLLARMNERADEPLTRGKGWPKNGQALSGGLKRLAPSLRASGIDVTFDRDKRTRFIRLEYMAERSSPASPASLPEGDAVTIFPPGDDVQQVQQGHRHRLPRGNDAGDDGDDLSATQSKDKSPAYPPCPECGQPLNGPYRSLGYDTRLGAYCERCDKTMWQPKEEAPPW